MTEVAQRSRTVTSADNRALVIDGKWTPISRWAGLDPDSLTWGCDKPDWIDTALAEMRWARDCGERHAAVVVNDSVIVMHPYALTLRDTIDNLGVDYEFEPFLDAWIVRSPRGHSDALRDICDQYMIAQSPKFEDYLTGLDEAIESVIHSAETALDEGYVIPTGFASGRVLKPHQEEAVLSLAINGGGLLADQVGLGKGGEFICGLLCQNDFIERQGGEANYPVVVAVTKSMKLEIAEEILKWKADAVIEVLSGVKPSPIGRDTEFIIVNHDLVSRRLEDLLAAKPRALIADEAHVYKNKETKRTEAITKIARAVRTRADHSYIVMATGTPFLNAPRELWALIVVLGWDGQFFDYARRRYEDENDGSNLIRTRVGREQNRFKNAASGGSKLRWEMKPIWPQRAFEVAWCGGTYDKYGAWWNDKATNAHNLNRLLLDAGMIRRRKSDVINPLPPLTENLYRFSLSDEMMSRYNQISDEFRDWLIEQVTREARRDGRNVKRAVDNAVRKLLAGEDVMRLTKLRSELSLLKVPHTVEWVHRFMAGEMSDDETDGREKLILYVHHRDARDALLTEPTLQKYNPVHILPSTDQSDQSIVEHKREFQANPDVRLIICTMAAREGHTLTAAKDVYIHEMPFVPSWIVQMAGRCWARFSEEFEPHEAHLHYAIAEDTIDSMLVRMNAVKKSMFSSVIDGEGQDGDDDLNWGKVERQEGESWADARARQSERLLEAFAIGTKDLEIAR